MPERQTHVIIGAALAGAKAAEALREEGFEGRIVLVGDEDELPYERPPLSKDYLRGESEREKAQVHDAGFYESHDIELLRGVRGEAIDPSAGSVPLDGGRGMAFDSLLLATGAEPRRLPFEGVHYLRSLDASDALRERIKPGVRFAIVGAGCIGSEVAASARALGADVTLV